MSEAPSPDPQAASGPADRSGNLLARLVFWALLAVVALAPLPFGANRPWSAGLLALAVGVLVILWAIAAFRNPEIIRIRLRRHWPMTLLFSLLVLWTLFQASSLAPVSWHHPLWRDAGAALGESLSGAISVDANATLGALMRLLTYGGVFWLALQFGRDPRRARQVLWAVAAAGMAYAIYGFAVELSGSETILWLRKWAYQESMTSTFVNRNSYATYAGLTLITVMALVFRRERAEGIPNPLSRDGVRAIIDGFGSGGWFFLVMILTAGAALLLTHSRGGFAAAGVGTVVLIVGLAMAGRMRPQVGALYTAIFALLAAGVIMLSGSATIERLDSEGALGGERPMVYALTAEAIGERPLEGTGLGTFQWIFAMHRDTTVGRFYDKAHNSYLEWALGAGLPALAVMLLLMAVIAGFCVRGLFQRRRDVIYPCLGLAATALVGSHALIDFSLQIPAVGVTYCLLLGVACAQSWKTRKPRGVVPQGPRESWDGPPL